MNTKEKITFSAIALATLALLVLFGGVSDEDLAKCQETTGWSKDRCLHEIMR